MAQWGCNRSPSIKTAEGWFTEKFGPISNTGTNDNFSTTKTLKFGTRTSEEAKFDGLMAVPRLRNTTSRAR